MATMKANGMHVATATTSGGREYRIMQNGAVLTKRPGSSSFRKTRPDSSMTETLAAYCDRLEGLGMTIERHVPTEALANMPKAAKRRVWPARI